MSRRGPLFWIVVVILAVIVISFPASRTLAPAAAFTGALGGLYESTSTAARERLAAFVGEWTIEAGPPEGPPWPGSGRVTFEWLEGAPLLVMRSHVDLAEAPATASVIGCDGKNDTYYQLYTDDRDVQRIYEMSLADGVWKLWRDGEPFSQRFTCTFSEDGNTIAGRWEIAEDGETWQTDFDLTYTRVR